MTEEEKAKELADAVSALGDVFMGRIPQTMISMEEELRLITLDSQNQTALKTLHRLLHTMAGSAGMFGYPELGDRAKDLEIRINNIMKSVAGSVGPATPEFVTDHHAFIAWARKNYVKS